MNKARTLLGVATVALLTASTAMARPDQAVVRWESFVGTFELEPQAQSLRNGSVNAAGAPWSQPRERSCESRIRGLAVRNKRLVLADTIFVGTPGNNPEVVGTLVCDTDGSAGGGNSVLVSTPRVPLSEQERPSSMAILARCAACVNEPDTRSSSERHRRVFRGGDRARAEQFLMRAWGADTKSAPTNHL